MGSLPTGTVTFLLTDVPDSVERWEQAPDRTAAALTRLDEVVEATAAGFDGRLVKPRGENDSHFLVFASATGALEAALRLGVTAAAERLVPVRMALTTGPAAVQGGDYLGPIVNHCARLRAAAHAGQVVIGAPAATAIGAELPAGADLVDLGWHWLKDLERPLRAFELRHPDLPSGFAPLRSLAPPAPNLPVPLTSLVGRDREIAAVLDALATGAPVTVVGAPGAGKSRVATEVAVAVGRTGQSLIRFLHVGEEPIPDIEPSPVPTLLVFDDVDLQRDRLRTLIDERPRSPDLTVVATARGPLGTTGEVVVRTPPLPADEAMRLLADRAERARPGVVLGSTGDALTAALSGLPLAIELAAARLAVLTPDQLLARLATPERILSSRSASPTRHRSMLETVAWTVGELSAPAQEALQALAARAPTASSMAQGLAELGWAEATPDGPQVLPVLAPFVSAALGGERHG